MKDALEALAAFLAPLSYATFIVWADTASAQYVVLEGRGWDDPDELPLCGTSESFDTEIRVKVVTGTPGGAMIMLDRLREHLSPSRRETRIPQSGRDLRIRYVRPEAVYVDEDETITGTNRHPAIGVASYRLTSQPL